MRTVSIMASVRTVSIMAFYARDMGELRGYVSREPGPTGHLKIVSCSYYSLLKHVEFCA